MAAQADARRFPLQGPVWEASGVVIDIVDAFPAFLARQGLERATDLTGAVRVEDAIDPLWQMAG